MTFHEALAARLAIMRPSRAAIDAFLAVLCGRHQISKLLPLCFIAFTMKVQRQ